MENKPYSAIMYNANTQSTSTLSIPKASDWECHIVGIRYIPTKVNEPNLFNRLMMRLFFGAVWKKVEK